MKVVTANGNLRIYGEDLIVNDKIPVGVWDVCISKAGFHLSKHSDVKITEKIYGPHERKALKVIDSFKTSTRSLGVILSGDKGIGKSITAKLIAIDALADNIPVLMVNYFAIGLPEFIESIEQEVVVIFDEFDKNFAKCDECDPQEAMLSLFDGFGCGKKLYVITCNEINNLNDCILNRPGRFLYHFRYANPSENEIMEYMQDNLKPEYHNEIKKIVSFGRKVKLNFDCLRAIAQEINKGYDFEEAISDLNILNTEMEVFSIMVFDEDGHVMVKTERELDPFDNEAFHFVSWQSRVCWEFSFVPNKADYDMNLLGYCLDKGSFQAHIISNEDQDDPDGDEMTSIDFSETEEKNTRKMHRPSKIVYKQKVKPSLKYFAL